MLFGMSGYLKSGGEVLKEEVWVACEEKYKPEPQGKLRMQATEAARHSLSCQRQAQVRQKLRAVRNSASLETELCRNHRSGGVVMEGEEELLLRQ